MAWIGPTLGGMDFGFAAKFKKHLEKKTEIEGENVNLRRRQLKWFSLFVAGFVEAMLNLKHPVLTRALSFAFCVN